jgi:CO/xanthine dehydrogenase Mo-binding subunit
MDSMVMGIGMALFEQTTYDPQNGAPINSASHRRALP